MHNLRSHGDAQDEAQRFQAEQAARPDASDEEAQYLWLASAAIQSMKLDRLAGRWADADMHERKAREYAARWRALKGAE